MYSDCTNSTLMFIYITENKVLWIERLPSFIIKGVHCTRCSLIVLIRL